MTPRLAVSNLAWTTDLDCHAFQLLADNGVRGVEVAPTRIADWDALSPAALRQYRERLADVGLVVSSLQAVLFQIKDAELLGSPDHFANFFAHMQRVADIGAALGADVAVFGAPRNRLLNGLSEHQAMELAANRLGLLASYFSQSGMVLGIEPVPAHYGGEFLTHAGNVVELVKRIDSPAIRLHLDTGCVKLGGDQIGTAITEHAGLLAHFHIAEPDLIGFEAPTSDHEAAAAALRSIGYSRWISIEMKPQPPDAMTSIQQAVQFACQTYFRSEQMA